MLLSKMHVVLCLLLVTVVVALGAPAPASAYVIPFTLEELTELSETVAEVHVREAGANSRRANGRVISIDTEVDLQVTRVFKGRDRESIAFTQPGGRADGYVLEVSDMPDFKPGERAIVFLDEAGVVGGWQGKLDIVDGSVPTLGLTLAEVRQAIRELVKDGSTQVTAGSSLQAADGEVFSAEGDAGTVTLTSAPVVLFESTFEGGSTSGWRMSGDPTWAPTTYRRMSGTGSLYGSGGASTGVAAPGPTPQAVWAEAVRILPVDLRGYTEATLSWDVWTAITSNTGNWMNVRIATSPDGPWYTPQGTFAMSSGYGWRSFKIDLRCVTDQFTGETVDFMREPEVYVGLAVRHTTGTSDEGVYVDNVRLAADVRPGPKITSVSPPFTPAGVGARVTIEGSEFGDAPGRVEFLRGDSQSGARVAAPTVLAWSDTAIAVEVPRLAQPGPVWVTDAAGVTSGGHVYAVGFSAFGATWDAVKLPVTFRIAENAGGTTGERGAITSALQTWSSAGSKFRFAYGGATDTSAYPPSRDGHNDIYFTHDRMPTGALAQAFIMFDLGGRIAESDIVFADAAYEFRVGVVNGAFDIETVALHELGHAVGLDDQYGSLDRAMGAIPSGATRRALSPFEILGAVHLYGAEADYVAPDPSTWSPPPPVWDEGPGAIGSLLVEPIAGANRFDTAVEISHRAFPDGLDPKGPLTVVIATGANWPDALGGTSLAGTLGAPVLLVDTNSVPASVVREMRRLGARNAIILGGPAAVSWGVQNKLNDALPGRVDRIAGSNRYQTADRVAQRVIKLQGSSWDGTVLVATGGNYPDALAVSPLAAANKWPLLLVEPGKVIGAGTRSVIGQPKRVLLLGGTGAVSSGAERDVRARFSKAEVRRLQGRDRYTTAVAIATYGAGPGGLRWNGVAIATGENFPDALAGGVLQGRRGSVMVLSGTRSICSSALGSLSSRKSEIDHVTYLGGQGAVCTTVRTQVNQALQ